MDEILSLPGCESCVRKPERTERTDLPGLDGNGELTSPETPDEVQLDVAEGQELRWISGETSLTRRVLRLPVHA